MPKGDAEHGKADTLDGFARVAKVLLEELACAPLSGAEFQVVFFVIRRTYGWAGQGGDPNRGKIDVMTAKDVAIGTGLEKRTAEKALGTLVKENVIVRIPLEEHPGSQCAYGINTCVAEWYGGPEWRAAKVAKKQAQETGSYTQNSVVPIPEKVYWLYTKKCSGNAEKSVVVAKSGDGVSHCGTGPEHQSLARASEKETDERKNDLKENDSEEDAHPADTRLLELPAEEPKKAAVEPVTKPPSAPRMDTPSQQAANACLALWSLTHSDLAGPQAGKYYAAMNKLIEGLAGGAEELQAWADAEAANGQRVLGAGAKPEAAIPAAVRKEVTAKSWQQSFAAARQAAPAPGQRFIRHQDGSIQYERDWEPEQKNSIRIAVQAGTWDEKLGIDRNAPWHPDYGKGASL